MKDYEVFLIADAEEDLYEIYNYVYRYDSVQKAVKLLRKIEEAYQSLSQFPNRGHIPPELKRIGIFEYKEIHYEPYRIVYQIVNTKVYVHCIFDGRRDIQQLLQERLLR